MVTATVVFAVAWLLQRPGYVHDTVKPGGWIVAVLAELLLAAGGYIGGSIVFVYGNRVVNRPQSSPAEALRPRAEPSPERAGAEGRTEAPASTTPR